MRINVIWVCCSIRHPANSNSSHVDSLLASFYLQWQYCWSSMDHWANSELVLTTKRPVPYKEKCLPTVGERLQLSREKRNKHYHYFICMLKGDVWLVVHLWVVVRFVQEAYKQGCRNLVSTAAISSHSLGACTCIYVRFNYASKKLLGRRRLAIWVTKTIIIFECPLNLGVH